jgi:hypothetical protein
MRPLAISVPLVFWLKAPASFAAAAARVRPQSALRLPPGRLTRAHHRPSGRWLLEPSPVPTFMVILL